MGEPLPNANHAVDLLAHLTIVKVLTAEPTIPATSAPTVL